MKKTRKECKTKQVKLMRYFFWRRVRHHYFTSLTISLNRKRWIIPIKILILYEHLITFSQSLRVLWIYASLRNAELVRKEEALYLRFFTQELKIRKFWISCCACPHSSVYFIQDRTIVQINSQTRRSNSSQFSWLLVV